MLKISQNENESNHKSSKVLNELKIVNAINTEILLQLFPSIYLSSHLLLPCDT
jgi:hypothetical protein